MLSQIFRFLRLVLSAGLHLIEQVEQPLIWCKKLPNKALATFWASSYAVVSSSANLLVNNFLDLRFWNLANFLEGDIEPVFSTDIGTWTTRFAFSDDRRFFATQGEDGFIRVWAVLAGQ